MHDATKTWLVLAIAGWLAAAAVFGFYSRQLRACQAETDHYTGTCAEWLEELERCRALLEDVA